MITNAKVVKEELITVKYARVLIEMTTLQIVLVLMDILLVLLMGFIVIRNVLKIALNVQAIWYVWTVWLILI